MASDEKDGHATDNEPLSENENEVANELLAQNVVPTPGGPSQEENGQGQDNNNNNNNEISEEFHTPNEMGQGQMGQARRIRHANSQQRRNHSQVPSISELQQMSRVDLLQVAQEVKAIGSEVHDTSSLGQEEIIRKIVIASAPHDVGAQTPASDGQSANAMGHGPATTDGLIQVPAREYEQQQIESAKQASNMEILMKQYADLSRMFQTLMQQQATALTQGHIPTMMQFASASPTPTQPVNGPIIAPVVSQAVQPISQAPRQIVIHGVGLKGTELAAASVDAQMSTAATTVPLPSSGRGSQGYRNATPVPPPRRQATPQAAGQGHEPNNDDTKEDGHDDGNDDHDNNDDDYSNHSDNNNNNDDWYNDNNNHPQNRQGSRHGGHGDGRRQERRGQDSYSDRRYNDEQRQGGSSHESDTEEESDDADEILGGFPMPSDLTGRRREERRRPRVDHRGALLTRESDIKRYKINMVLDPSKPYDFLSWLMAVETCVYAKIPLTDKMFYLEAALAGDAKQNALAMKRTCEAKGMTLAKQIEVILEKIIKDFGNLQYRIQDTWNKIRCMRLTLSQAGEMDLDKKEVIRRSSVDYIQPIVEYPSLRIFLRHVDMYVRRMNDLLLRAKQWKLHAADSNWNDKYFCDLFWGRSTVALIGSVSRQRIEQNVHGNGKLVTDYGRARELCGICLEYFEEAAAQAANQMQHVGGGGGSRQGNDRPPMDPAYTPSQRRQQRQARGLQRRGQAWYTPLPRVWDSHDVLPDLDYIYSGWNWQDIKYEATNCGYRDQGDNPETYTYRPRYAKYWCSWCNNILHNRNECVKRIAKQQERGQGPPRGGHGRGNRGGHGGGRGRGGGGRGPRNPPGQGGPPRGNYGRNNDYGGHGQGYGGRGQPDQGSNRGGGAQQQQARQGPNQAPRPTSQATMNKMEKEEEKSQGAPQGQVDTQGNEWNMDESQQSRVSNMMKKWNENDMEITEVDDKAMNVMQDDWDYDEVAARDMVEEKEEKEPDMKPTVKDEDLGEDIGGMYGDYQVPKAKATTSPQQRLRAKDKPLSEVDPTLYKAMAAEADMSNVEFKASATARAVYIESMVEGAVGELRERAHVFGENVVKLKRSMAESTRLLKEKQDAVKKLARKQSERNKWQQQQQTAPTTEQVEAMKPAKKGRRNAKKVKLPLSKADIQKKIDSATNSINDMKKNIVCLRKACDVQASVVRAFEHDVKMSYALCDAGMARDIWENALEVMEQATMDAMRTNQISDGIRQAVHDIIECMGYLITFYTIEGGNEFLDWVIQMPSRNVLCVMATILARGAQNWLSASGAIETTISHEQLSQAAHGVGLIQKYTRCGPQEHARSRQGNKDKAGHE